MMPRTRFNVGKAVVSSLLLASTITAQTCYWIDGSVADGPQPCFPEQTGGQTCCHSTHTCLSNGLCYDGVNLHVLRGACTDKGFGGDCANICTDIHDDWGNLRQCDRQNKQWVCGQDVSVCETEGATFTLTPGFVKDGRNATFNNVLQAGNFTAESAAADGDDDAASSAPTTSTGATEFCQPSPNLLKASTVGIVTGLAVGIPLLLGLVVTSVMLWRAKKRLAASPVSPSYSKVDPNVPSDVNGSGMQGTYGQPHQQYYSEMAAPRPPVELPH